MKIKYIFKLKIKCNEECRVGDYDSKCSICGLLELYKIKKEIT